MPKGDFAEKQWDAVPGKHTVGGSFAPNAASAIDNTQNTGRKFTATWVSVGRYRVTIPGTFRRVISHRVNVQLAAAPAGVTDLFATVITTGPSTSATVLEFLYREAAALTNIAAAAGNRIHFSVDLEAGR